jgi:predicted AlkP superfamily phosphohydrolase/phosphomutase
VLVVGLDGATFDIIHPLVREGRLPNLARLMKEGAWGTLRSTAPPISPTAWTTFATGKNPGRHGVFDFRHLSHDYEWQVRPRQQHGHKSLWRLLSEAGRHVVAVDVPFTYPPEAVNGLMITGYPTPRTPDTVFYHPPALPERLREAGFHLALGWPEDRIDVHPDFFRAWEAVMDERERVLDYLFHEEPWDLFMVVFGITDTLAHTLWQFLEPAHLAFRDEKAESYREALFHGYEQADRLLGQLWSRVDEDTHLLVLSDHGFGTVRPRQWLFRFLAERDWLHFKQAQGVGGLLAPLRGAALKAYTEIGWLRRLIRELRPGAKGKLRSALAQGGLLAESRNVAHSTSPAIPSDMGTHLYLNRTGRFAHGFLDDEAAGRLAQEIREALLEARDPVDGKPIVAAVHLRDDLYTGEAVEQAPDLLIEYANRYAPSDTPEEANPGLEGGHVPEGILLASGVGIQPGHVAETALRHLAPTILHLMGEPVPPDMDGAVLSALLKTPWMEGHPIAIAAKPATYEETETLDYEEDDEEAVEAQLRALGYIE